VEADERNVFRNAFQLALSGHKVFVFQSSWLL